MVFQDRTHAGRLLGRRLVRARLPPPVVVLALPRGGVPVAAQIASALGVPLEVFVARKIGAPGQEEFGIGAVAEGSVGTLTTPAAALMGISADRMEALAERARSEIQRKIQMYRQGRDLPSVQGHTVILVDDGLATGVTAEAALRSLLRGDPRRLILAAPVCPRDTRNRLSHLADEVVCLQTPDDFSAVGQWYQRFDQTTDAEVVELLAASRARHG